MTMHKNPAEPGKKLDYIINTWDKYRVLEQIECEDGYKLSVQASGGHYCTDANNSRAFYWKVDPSVPPLPFSTVEVLASNLPDSWDEYDSSGVYAFVPARMVRDLIDSHGGEKRPPVPTQLDRIEAALERIVENTTPTKTTVTFDAHGDLARANENARRYFFKEA